jgi:hypothetical protein
LPSIDSDAGNKSICKEQDSDIPSHPSHRGSVLVSGQMNVSPFPQSINHRCLQQEGLMEDMVSEAIGQQQSQPGVTDVTEAKNSRVKLLHPSRQLLEKHTSTSDSALHNLSFTDRIKVALTQYLHLSGNAILVQLWAPQKLGDRVVLTTDKQPCIIHAPTPNNDSYDCLSKYREISNRYSFSAEQDDPDALPGLPGRVFLKKLPEWTPNVQFYSKSEYLRVDYAKSFGIRGSLALPVVEKDSGRCAAVLELVMSTEKLDYKSEIESVCDALNVMCKLLFNLTHSTF